MRVKHVQYFNHLCLTAEHKEPRKTVASGLYARRPEHRNRNVQLVREDFEHRATQQMSRAVGLSGLL